MGKGSECTTIAQPVKGSITKKSSSRYIIEQVLFLTDILPTSYRGVTQGGVQPGDTVVILGCGPVGQLAQKWAAYVGATPIIAEINLDSRLEHARKFNDVEVVNFSRYDNTGE